MSRKRRIESVTNINMVIEEENKVIPLLTPFKMGKFDLSHR